MIRTETYYGGRLVEPGATWVESVDTLRFQVQTRCESASPLSFTGRVYLDGAELLATEPKGSIEQAAAAARAALRERVVKALGTA